jgi:hypothetical protein
MTRLFVMGSLLAALLVGVAATGSFAEDTPKAAKTRQLLKTKVTLKFNNTRLADALDEIKEEVKGLRFRIDAKGGVSQNIQLTGEVKDGTVEELLNMLFEKVGLGYIVISNQTDAYDGLVLIKMGKERGSPLKEE